MSFADREHPLWRWLLLACAIATAVPLWLYRYLPITDLPQHAAMIGTLRHFGDPLWSAPYQLALGSTQYVLYYLFGALLAFPFGTAERANLVLLTATAIALPYAMRSLCRAIRADERLALFAPALFWNESLIIGFFNYLAALPILLWAMALLIRNAEAPERRTTLQLAIVSALLFYLHLSAFAFFALAAAIAYVALPLSMPPSQRLSKLPKRLLWAAPTAVLALLWLLTSPVVHPEKVGFAKVAPDWQSITDALRGLPEALLDIWRGPQDEWCLLALAALAALLALPQRRDEERPEATRARLVIALCALASAALYFVTPVSIGWLWALNHRYAITTALLIPPLLRPAARGLRSALPLLGAAGVGLFAALVAQQNIAAFQREVGPFDSVLQKAEPGKRLLALIYDRGSNVAGFAPFLQFGAYYRARKGGIAEFSFSELPQSPLRYKPGVVPPQRPPRWEWMPETFRNERDGQYYDYLLQRGGGNPFARSAGGPEWRIAAQEGQWRLWQRR